MRVRITQTLSGSIDGIQLGRFKEGHMYDMGISLASYLVALSYAAPVTDERPALIVPLDDASSDDTVRISSVHEPTLDRCRYPNASGSSRQPHASTQGRLFAYEFSSWATQVSPRKS